MNRLFKILLFFMLLLLSASHAFASTAAPDRIVTVDKNADFGQQPEGCPVTSGHAICKRILYHYEIDEQGRLYFTRVTAYEERSTGAPVQPSTSESVFICQLD